MSFHEAGIALEKGVNDYDGCHRHGRWTVNDFILFSAWSLKTILATPIFCFGIVWCLINGDGVKRERES